MADIDTAVIAAPQREAREAVPGRPPRGERLVFLDALRGFALIALGINHTARWWQDRIMGWPRYYTVYVTMAIAAPIFVFLVGFCLPLSGSREERRPALLLWQYAKRGVRLILAGFLLNVLVFPEDPIYSNGVLQTIGLAIIVGAAASLLLRHRGGRSILLAAAVLFYLSFGWSLDALKAWVTDHERLSRALFFEFPPWPWLSLVIVGLVLGDRWVAQPERPARARYMWTMLAVGLGCFAWLFGYDRYAN